MHTRVHCSESSNETKHQTDRWNVYLWEPIAPREERGRRLNHDGQIVGGGPQSPRVAAIDVDKARLAHARIGRIKRRVDVQWQVAAICFAVMLEGGISGGMGAAIASAICTYHG